MLPFCFHRLVGYLDLNSYENIVDFDCISNTEFSMTVSDMDQAKADLSQGLVLTGGTEWGCISDQTTGPRYAVRVLFGQASAVVSLVTFLLTW